MSLYIGTSTNTVADLVASSSQTQIVKHLLQSYYFPPVGSTKLLARSSLHNNEIQGISHHDGRSYRIKSDVDFLGWVVADGSCFSAEDFTNTCGMFTVQNGIFKVPDLRSFYKIDNTTTSISSDCQQSCQIMFDSSHQHSISCDVEIKTDAIIKECLSCVTTSETTEGGAIIQRSAIKYKANGSIDCKTLAKPVLSSSNPPASAIGPRLSDLCESDGKYNDSIPAFHHGTTKQATTDIFTAPIVMTDNTNIGELNVGQTGQRTPDCYPRNIKLIPMIYIGAVLI